MMNWYWGMGPWAWIVMTLFWVAVIAIGVYAATRLFPRGEERPREAPLEVLEQRFARGEIDTEDYLRARDTLRAGAK